MIDDLANYADRGSVEADLCIVGAGPAGLVLAREFLRSSLSVVLLESGPMRPEPAREGGPRIEAEGLSKAALELSARGFGGNSRVWSGQCIPLDDADFDRRDWVPHSGWPIGSTTLAPYYTRAAILLGIPGETYDEALWRRWRMEPPPLDRDKLRHRYTAWTTRTDLGRSLRGDFKRSRSVRVLLNASVTAIETNADATAFDHVVARRVEGGTVRVSARACVLCCGGIENARLLLASGRPDAGGLGNEHDNVGRFFQDHPQTPSAVLRGPRLSVVQEQYSMLHRRSRSYLPKLALAPAVQRSEGVLNCVANLEFLFADEAVNALRRVYLGARRHREGTTALRQDLQLVAGGLPAAAATVYRRARGRSTLSPPARTVLRTHPEQAPNRDSRVVLSSERDALGSRRARVQWRLTDLERRTAEVMARTVDVELRRLGLAEAELAGWVVDGDPGWARYFGDSYHHIGTTRMSAAPSEGVVNRECELHRVSGIYVGGSSVFPTSGFANPTLTIVALSLRLADHLRRQLAPRSANPRPDRARARAEPAGPPITRP